MAGFVITTATNTILLDESGIGEASFTATNRTGRAVRARASAVALPPTVAEWLAVADDLERDFPIDGAEQFVLRVDSKGAPAGTYPVRLDLASTTNPDDEWGQSPVVAFQIPEGPEEPPQPPPKDRPGYVETLIGSLIGLAIAVVAALVFLFIASVSNESGFAVVGVLVLFLGSWILPAIGTNVALTRGAFPEPSRTALVQVIAVVFIGLPIFVVLIAIGNNVFDADFFQGFGFENFGSLFLLILDLIIMTVATAMIARAIVRWRQTGHL